MSSCSGPFCCSESQEVCKNLLPAVKSLMFIKISISEWNLMFFPQHISCRDLRGNSIFIKAQRPPLVYHMPNLSVPDCSACGNVHCTVDSNQIYLLSCFRANRRAVAGSEWRQGSLLLRVEWWDSCDIHQMAVQASHLHERSGALRRYEGAGTPCTHFTATQINNCINPKSLTYVLIKESFVILSWNSFAPKFGINHKRSSEVRRHQKGRKHFPSYSLLKFLVWWKVWSRNFTLNSFPWFRQSSSSFFFKVVSHIQILWWIE